MNVDTSSDPEMKAFAVERAKTCTCREGDTPRKAFNELYTSCPVHPAENPFVARQARH